MSKNIDPSSNPKVLWAKPNDLHTHSPDCRGSGCIDVVAKLDHDRLQIQLRVVSAQRDEYAARLGLGAMPSVETSAPKPCRGCGKYHEPPECSVSWLIEDGASPPRYRTADSNGFGWTLDVSKAIRLARRCDAEMLAAADDAAWRIVEHMWCNSPEEPEAPTFQTPQFAGLAFRHWSKDPAVPYAECQCDTCLPLKAPCCDGSGKIPYTDEQARERVKRCNICQPKPIAEGAIDPDDKGHKP